MPVYANRNPYLLEFGRRLREARQHAGLSLRDVESASGGEWRSMTIGSYERGDRALSVERLHRLAAFYGTPIEFLIPDVSPRGRETNVLLERIKLMLTHSVDLDAARAATGTLSPV